MEDNYKTLEAYFHGRMSAKEAQDFNTAMDANPELKSSYLEYESIKRAAADIEKDKLRQQLEAIDIGENIGSREKIGNKGRALVIRTLKLSVAAAVLFIIGFWGYQASHNSSPQQLFAQNFEVYNAQKSRGSNIEPPKINANNLNTPELKLIYATQLLKNEQVNEAIKYLNEISDESTFRDQKYWYLALANLKAGKIEVVKQHINHLQKLSSYKKNEIERILSELN